MENQIKAPVTREVQVAISVWVNNRQYQFLIPSGVAYEEAYTVALEMGSIVKQMQEENRKAQEAQAEQPQQPEQPVEENNGQK